MVSVEAPGTWHTLHWPGPSQGPASGLASAWRCLARRQPLQHCRWQHHRYRGYVTTQTNVTELIENERNIKKIVQYYQ